MYDNQIVKLINKLNIFEKAFDSIRLVDPVNKKVISLRDDTIEDSAFRCCEIWGKGRVCNNCISMRAYRENETFIKMEYSENEIYMLTAVPIELEGRLVVLELLKNATNSLLLNSKEKDKNLEIRTMIDNMNNMAVTDSLTGIYNRRYINEKLPVDLANANSSVYHLSVVLADIDFFKKVNDTYGHVIGDYTLKHFAELIKQSLKREGDWVARYGGEEFLICLHGASHDFAVEVAENIRKVVEESLFQYGDSSFHITASFGVSSVIPNANASLEELIDDVDKKLYEAKRNGRNRVEA